MGHLRPERLFRGVAIVLLLSTPLMFGELAILLFAMFVGLMSALSVYGTSARFVRAIVGRRTT